MRVVDKLYLAVALLLGVFGVVMVAAMLAAIFDKTTRESVPEDITLLILIGVLPLVLGIWLYRQTKRGISEREFAARERIVLDLARRYEGTLTAPLVVQNSSMTLEQAKMTLDYLQRKQFNEMAVTESGAVVYRFQL